MFSIIEISFPTSKSEYLYTEPDIPLEISILIFFGTLSTLHDIFTESFSF